MSKDPFAFVENIINEKTIKKAGNIITNIVAGILAFVSVLFIISAGVFITAALTTGLPFFYVPSVFLGITGIIIGIGSYRTKKGILIKNRSRDHYRDYRSCEDILKSVKFQMKTDRISREEYHHIFDTMKKELAEAKIIVTKIDNIGKTLKSPDCNVAVIDGRIREEKSKDPANENLVKTLENHRENVIKLENHEKKLRDQISNLKFNFNSVFTKLTLLDTQSRPKFDDIETDLQKILDFKLEVSRYEDELLRDI